MENNKFLNVIGMMSGTSIDGIDVSHLVTDGSSTLKPRSIIIINIQKQLLKCCQKVYSNIMK